MTSAKNPGHRPNTDFLSAVAWLFAATIAAFVAINTLPMSYSVNGYVPAGNDSFYHARRILDTVEDPSSFYQFDPKINAPDGSWVSWPWAYDYLMGRTARLVLPITGYSDPMTVLAYIPVVWTFVNTGLLMLIAASLGIGLWGRLLAGLAFGLSMTSQILHGVGMLDHHFIELTFILLAIWTTMRWHADTSDPVRAGIAGLVLGLAPAFHIALFILQVPVLLWLLRLRVAGTQPSMGSSIVFAVALTGSTLAMLLGSEPFWQGLWQFHLFSWFHLYIASITALVSVLNSALRHSTIGWAGLAAFAGAALVPLLGPVVNIAEFFQTSLPGLSRIIETQSLMSAFSEEGGYWLTTYFTYLALVTPLTLVACAAAYFIGGTRNELPFAAFGLLAIPLFFLQLRFKYFGIAFLILGPIWGAYRLYRAREAWRPAIAAVVVVMFLAAYVPSLMGRAGAEWRLGLDPRYGWSLGLMPDLNRACQQEPGIVLAYPGEGHHIRYHTDCSVIGTNFLITKEQAANHVEISELMRLSPAQLRQRRPDIRYVLALFDRFEETRSDGAIRLARKATLVEHNRHVPLMTSLLLTPTGELSGFELIDDEEVRFPSGETVSFARLFRVVPIDSGAEELPEKPQ